MDALRISHSDCFTVFSELLRAQGVNRRLEMLHSSSPFHKRLLALLMPTSSADFRQVLRSVAAATLIAVGLACQAEAAERRQIPAHIADRLDGILGPYQQGASQIVQVRLNKPNGRYVEGDIFAFEIETRERASYVHIDYFQLDGNVVHILPSPALAENLIRRGATVAIGVPNSGVVYDVLPPFGRELLVIIATSSQLFDEPRQEFEDSHAYLDALVSGLVRAEAAGREPAVVFRFVDTYPRDAVLAGTGTAATSEPPTTAADAEVKAQSWKQQTTAPRPLSDATISAGVSNSAVILPSTKADDFYTVEVAPLLARMAEHPEDNENAKALAAAYGGYARNLSEVGRFTKARRILALAMALDLDNPDLATIDKEVENSATAVQSLAEASRHLVSGELDQAYKALVRARSIAPDGGLVQAKLAEISSLVAQRLNEWGASALDRGDPEEAEASWKRVLSFDPRNETAENGLDRIGAKAGNLEAGN